MANENGIVLDLFQFEDREDYLRLNTTAGQELIDLLGDVVAGKIDITAKLEGRKRSKIHKHPSRRLQTSDTFQQPLLEAIHSHGTCRRKRFGAASPNQSVDIVPSTAILNWYLFRHKGCRH